MENVAVEAPFEMPTITIPDFSQCPQFLISSYGAVPGDKRATSKAIAECIKKANNAGGGMVVIPAGSWLTGPIHLQSNVCLHLETGAVLEFSEDPTDYLPTVKTSWEGMDCYNYSPLIYAYECENVAITGKGKLKARLDVWSIWYARPPAHMNALKRLYDMMSTNVPVEERQMTRENGNLRPHFIQFYKCENILLEDISIEDSPFWVIHPFRSKNIVIRGVSVNAHGHNNDGVDPEMSQNILIENCVFDQGDDAIAIKSGRNQDAWRANTPTRNLVMRNCLIRNAHQLAAIGSELSGGIENVLIEDCSVDPAISNVMHLLFIKTNERRGGYVKNIHMRNITAGALSKGILGIETDVMYQWRDLVKTYEKRLTPISDIFLKNVTAGEIDFVTHIAGNAELPIQNVQLESVKGDVIGETPYMNTNVLDFVNREPSED